MESPLLHKGQRDRWRAGRWQQPEKQLTFTNSVREAFHWGYTGAECHPLPGPNSFITPSRKGRHTLIHICMQMQ